MRISEVIVVEGKNDIMAVKRAVDAFVISTSGSGITKDLLIMLKKLHEERGIIVLCDPDGPGEKIRAIITEHIPTAHHAFITKDEAYAHNDIGIEHASPEAIKKSLENMITYNDKQSNLEFEDLVDYRLVGYEDSMALRQSLCNLLSITYSNGKTLLKRLKLLNIDRSQLAQLMEAIYE